MCDSWQVPPSVSVTIGGVTVGGPTGLISHQPRIGTEVTAWLACAAVLPTLRFGPVIESAVQPVNASATRANMCDIVCMRSLERKKKYWREAIERYSVR